MSGGSLCPTNPEHGLVFLMPNGKAFCSHVDHLGRPASHPLGRAPQSRAMFAMGELS